MFKRIRWRVALPSFVIFTIIVIGLTRALTANHCSQNAACVGQTVLIFIFLTAVGAFLLGIFLEKIAYANARKISEVADRIAAGELNARVMMFSSDQSGDPSKSFNNMVTVLRRSIYALQAENQQYSTILDNMTDGVLITDEDGIVQLINPAATRLLEPMTKAAIGRAYAEVVRHHQLIELWQKAEATKEPQTEAVDINREVFLQTAVTPFQENGNLGYLIILHDLTQIRHLQTVRRDFISNISHELRTPLASLKAVVETLQDGALNDPPVAHRFLLRAENEVDVLTQMVEELLELSRIESGQVPFKLKATAVSDLLLTPMERLRPQAKRKKIQLILDVNANPPLVLADEERVQRVVTNLLHNAIKFTPDEGTITVHASFSENEKCVIISVEDTGTGIASEELNRIFERFYKSDRARTRHQSGTGLGLAISRHIVQGHNGRIWVTSKEGKGSTFYFTLPIAELPA